MNRIDNLFQLKKNNVLSIYYTAGFPQLNNTLPILQMLEKYGADMVEIGMPFSDPLADGPVIQNSSNVALKNGMSLPLLFKQLKDMRKTISIPVILMGYYNPVYKYGFENFCKSCASVGVDGFILPDLPPDEYSRNYSELVKSYGLKNILLITPQTENSRIQAIDSLTEGFIYAVSSYATTGSDKGVQQSGEYFNKLKNFPFQHPVMIGFGIKDKQTFEYACQYANGGIIGTAFIKALSSQGAIENKVKDFIGAIK
jgi:tryptophan synthase alpha chain